MGDGNQSQIVMTEGGKPLRLQQAFKPALRRGIAAQAVIGGAQAVVELHAPVSRSPGLQERVERAGVIARLECSDALGIGVLAVSGGRLHRGVTPGTEKQYGQDQQDRE